MLYLLFLVINIYASESSHDSVIEMPNVVESQLVGSSMSTPIRDLCDEMIHYYFKGNGEHIRDHIKPYLQRRLDSSWKKQKLSRLNDIDLKRLSVKVEPDVERYINKKVSQAMEEAFQEEHETRMRYQTEARERCSKNKVAAITAITGVVTAAIAAGVTLAITFGT